MEKIFHELVLMFHEILKKTYKIIKQKNQQYNHKEISDVLWNTLDAIANKNTRNLSSETKECVADIHEFLSYKSFFLKDKDLELISKYLFTNRSEYMYPKKDIMDFDFNHDFWEKSLGIKIFLYLVKK